VVPGTGASHRQLPGAPDTALRCYCDKRSETFSAAVRGALTHLLGDERIDTAQPAEPPLAQLLAQLDDELRQHAASV
jgi:hypothetical protein